MMVDRLVLGSPLVIGLAPKYTGKETMISINNVPDMSPSSTSVSRRIFLSAFGAAAATVLTMPSGAQSQPAIATRLIDVHHHLVPPFYYDAVKDVIPKVNGQPLPGWLGWSPEKAL